MHTRQLVRALAAFTFATVALLSAGSIARGGVVVVPAHGTVAGQSLQDWTADWWNWAGSQTAGQDAITDTTGANAHANQSGPGPYSTDLGNISREMPTATITFAISETPIRGHSVEVVESSISPLGRENAIKTGKALALAAVDLFADPDLVAAAQAEFAGNS